jgi:hypothetical protein
MAIKIGNADITKAYKGSSAIDKIYKGNDLVVDWTTGGVSPEAQAVLNRMTNLSVTEENAIIAFVDSMHSRGDWSNVIECYCYALNQIDSLTGWKTYTGSIDKPGLWTHSNTRGYVTASTDTVNPIRTGVVPSDHWSASANDHDGSMGVWVTDNSYTGTSNQDFFGINESGVEMYLRHRGSDTNDVNCLFFGTTYSSRPNINQGDMKDDFFGIGRRPTDEQFMSKGLAEPTVSTIAFESVPTIETFVNARNNSGTPQNSRPTGYAFFIAFKPAPLNDYASFYGDLKTLLGTLGVTNIPA